MRWIIRLFQSLLCRHSWRKTEKKIAVYRSPTEEYLIENLIPPEEAKPYFHRWEIEVTATCTKCGKYREYVKD